MLKKLALVALAMLIASPAIAGGRRYYSYGGWYGSGFEVDQGWGPLYSGAPIFLSPPPPQVIIIQPPPAVIEYVPVTPCYQIQIGWDMYGRPMYSTTCQ